MKVPVSWLRDFADVPADPRTVAARLAACGFAVESIDGDTIDFEVTANRPDAMSVSGIAREARTAFRAGSREGSKEGSREGSKGSEGSRGSVGSKNAGPVVGVKLESELCRRYALAMADVTIAASPEWLTDRLTAAGVRPINNIVDITNYVMLEMGQPMHAFDAAKLAGASLSVRMAKAGERLTTLDGEARTLDSSMLVIADRDHAVAIAGVMGGRASEVSATTARVAIESAHFDPASVRRTSKKLGLKTEASMRFERGGDIGAPVHALERVLALLEETGAGRPSGAITDVFPHPPAPRALDLTRANLTRLVGASIPDADAERILTALGFIVAAAGGGWRVTVPTWRVDVLREVDLIEEVTRHWGFEHVPAALPALTTPPPALAFGAVAGTRLRRLLAGAGLQEAVTFTFMERAAAEPFAPAADDLVPIANPLSEKFAVLRPSLLPGLLESLVYNRRREASSVWLFEVGSVFGRNGETTRVGWIMTGPRAEHWTGHGGDADFFDAAGVAELVVRAGGESLETTQATEYPWYQHGRAARLTLGGRAADAAVTIGHAGQIRPDLVAARGLDSGAVYAGEIQVDARTFAAWAGPVDVTIAAIPRVPSVVRDLSIIVSESLPAASVRGTIWSDPPASLVDVREFDRYQGKGVPSGSVSLSLRLTFRDASRTLTDAEVQQGVDRIVAGLTRTHGAIVRGAAGPQAE